MMAPFKTVPEKADIATDFVLDNRQLPLPFDLPLTSQTDTAEEQSAICRWEDDGGAPGRES